MPKLIEEVLTALEAVRTHRGKKVVRICGRSASTLAQVEQAALLEGMTPEDFALLEGGLVASLESGDPSGSNAAPDTQSPTSLEGNPQHETIILTPGSAVYRADGMLAAISESGESGPVWCLPGDFKLFLEPGEDEHANLVREILVGSFRKFDDRNDHEIEPGNFYTEPEWDFVVGGARSEAMYLVQEIGFDPNVQRSDESKPRAESWLAERASADAEKARMDAEIKALKDQLAATPANSPVPSALPENALELLTGISGVGDKLAAKILSVLKGQE